jgi:hypothetical protein
MKAMMTNVPHPNWLVLLVLASLTCTSLHRLRRVVRSLRTWCSVAIGHLAGGSAAVAQD